MISFADLNITDGSPIYLQIIMYVKSGVASGSIANGDELPSRRVLSTLLGVNPNTVQKAYKLLEDEGIILSHPGAGSVVSVTESRRSDIRAELVKAKIQKSVEALKHLGLAKDAALELIDRNWE